MSLRMWRRATAALWAATLFPALAIATLPGAAETAREFYCFRLTHAQGATWSDAPAYFATNLRVVAAILIGAWARPRSGPLRPSLDVAILLTVAANAVLAGGALGAYGLAAARQLAHLPLEWGALGLALGTYCQAGQSTAAPASIARAALGAVAALAAAAALEAHGLVAA
jgi:hypothetical protein